MIKFWPKSGNTAPPDFQSDHRPEPGIPYAQDPQIGTPVLEQAARDPAPHNVSAHDRTQSGPDVVAGTVEHPGTFPGADYGHGEAPEPAFQQDGHVYGDHGQPGDHHLLEPVPGEGVLTVHGVKKSFKKRMVVRGANLSVGRGESVGLLGPNGAGKTTIFYMITGLIKADEGGVMIDGQDVTSMPMYRRARLGIGYLPQEASIFRGLSVEDNIKAVLELVEPNRKARAEQLDMLLEEFRITRLRKSPSIALSGGERRRVEIARALASRPSYMLLDEPFAGIDPIAIGDIRALVRHLTERGIGVLITDHNVRETLSLIDRAYIIYDGQVLMEGTPDEITSNEEVKRVYLGDQFDL